MICGFNSYDAAYCDCCSESQHNIDSMIKNEEELSELSELLETIYKLPIVHYRRYQLCEAEGKGRRLVKGSKVQNLVSEGIDSISSRVNILLILTFLSRTRLNKLSISDFSLFFSQSSPILLVMNRSACILNSS
jgi:hypothetical protein